MSPADAAQFAVASAAKKGRSASRELPKGQKRKSTTGSSKDTKKAIDEEKFLESYANVMVEFERAQRADAKEASKGKAGCDG